MGAFDMLDGKSEDGPAGPGEGGGLGADGGAQIDSAAGQTRDGFQTHVKQPTEDEVRAAEAAAAEAEKAALAAKNNLETKRRGRPPKNPVTPTAVPPPPAAPAGEPPPNHVPLNAMLEERRKYQARENDLQTQVAMLRAQLEGRSAGGQPPPQAPAFPDPLIDPEGFRKAVLAEAKTLYETGRKQSQEEVQVTRQQAQMAILGNAIVSHQMEFARTHPDLPQAIKHLQDRRTAMLSRLYGPENAAKAVQMEAYDVASRALANGLNIAEQFYLYAQDMGYAIPQNGNGGKNHLAPPPPAGGYYPPAPPQNNPALDAQRRALQHSESLSTMAGGGDSGGEMSIDDFARMPTARMRGMTSDQILDILRRG